MYFISPKEFRKIKNWYIKLKTSKSIILWVIFQSKYIIYSKCFWWEYSKIEIISISISQWKVLPALSISVLFDYNTY